MIPYDIRRKIFRVTERQGSLNHQKTILMKCGVTDMYLF